MVEAILLDRNLIIPASVYLQGEYGQSDICFGVPAKLGRGGFKEIIEYDFKSSGAAGSGEVSLACQGVDWSVKSVAIAAHSHPF